METEKFYFRVGLFAFAVMALFVGYLVVFRAGGEGQGVVRYAAYFDGSVAGMARGAPVRLKGLDVGVVTDIHFVARDNDRILVLMDLSGTAPVREDTIATVAFQGITGATYLALENTRPGETLPPLAAKPGEPFPTITSRPSDLQVVLASAPEVLNKLAQISDQSKKLLSDANIAALQEVILSTQGTLAEATAALREIRMLTRTVREDPSIVLRGPAYGGYKPKK